MTHSISALIVDDTQAVRETLKGILEGKGYHTGTARTSQEAVHRAKERWYNAALLDIGLPDGDSIELLRVLKEMQPEMVGIMIAGQASVKNAVAALNEGADSYLLKPLNLDEVLIVVDRALDRQRLTLENKRLVANLTILNTVSTTLNQALDLEEVLNLALDKVLEIVGVEVGGIQVLDESSGELILAINKGLPPEFVKRIGKLKISRGWMSQAVLPTGISKNLGPELVSGEELKFFACLPLESKERLVGVMTLACSGSRQFEGRDMQLMNAIGTQIGMIIENACLYEGLKRKAHDLEIARSGEQKAKKKLAVQAELLKQKRQELEEAYLEIGKTLTLTIEAREPYLKGHSERVAWIAQELAAHLGCSQRLLKDIQIAGRLHDIGKTAINDSILHKPGPLTAAEWAEVQRHPSRAVDILRSLGFLKGVLPLIEGHHEWYNGNGYPNRLKGDEIPLGARILAVADAFEAMTSERPYRPSMSQEEALKTLRSGAGVQWDPKVVETFSKTTIQQARF